ncbi:autotransporter outer membrane beta-barrel domain-containing protein [Luteimonas yindakuii]|uniref:Autotransporter outer membrane beta-barrel domain-containing protein n=1 Tax=Luteimonas yindakuii TaxID=2565782 RepID=A0A4Z1RLI5_9GAMM|nr:outer membrane beta-barrel protein [Luteimonas yindakuii]TKS54959.1 autotransporter outer membrane beta-barrel domain-containing protein [Luteimonas yindakuii]
MKKSMLPVVLAAIALSPAAFAQSGGDTYRPDLAVGEGNWFVAGNVGRTDGGTADRFGTGDFNVFESREGRRTGYGLAAGYRWKLAPAFGLGIEGGYTDLGNLEVRNAFRDDSVDQRDDENALRGWHVGGNARWHVTPAWYVGARGGYFRASDNSATYYNSVGQDLGLESGGRDGRNSWYAGVGTGWNATENFSVGLHYDYFRAKSGDLRDPVSGVTFEGPKRSTALLGLTAEYAF